MSHAKIGKILKTKMNVSFKITIILSLIYSSVVFSQQDRKAKFYKSEMIVEVSGKTIESTVVGKKCKLRISYRERRYYFECFESFNSESLYQTFEVIEVKNGKIITEFLFDVSEVKSKYVVKDSIDKKNKIEFIEYLRLENGEEAKRIYRFSNN